MDTSTIWRGREIKLGGRTHRASPHLQLTLILARESEKLVHLHYLVPYCRTLTGGRVVSSGVRSVCSGRCTTIGRTNVRQRVSRFPSPRAALRRTQSRPAGLRCEFRHPHPQRDRRQASIASLHVPRQHTTASATGRKEPETGYPPPSPTAIGLGASCLLSAKRAEHPELFRDTTLQAHRPPAFQISCTLRRVRAGFVEIAGLDTKEGWPWMTTTRL